MLTVAGVITVLVILYGQAVLKEDLLEGSEVIAVVQPNIPIEAPWHDRTFVDQMIQRHLSLSEEALLKNKNGAANDADRAAIVIWPESHMNFDYERDPALQQTLREFTARNKVTLLLNSWAYSTQWSNAEAVHNSAIAIGPSGDRIYRYDKIALVPFGEYVPARGLIPLMDRIPALVADVTPGQDLSLGLFGPVHLGVAICFETIRPDIARQMRTQGASALVQISNEAWFGPTAAPRQMLSHAVFRAVENNIVLIRATNSGLSARISSHGVVSGETQTFETATRRWRIPSVDEAPPMTFYSRSGDLFAGGLSVLSILVALACAAAEFWKRKKSDND